MLQLRLALCTIAVLLITSTCTASRTILVATSQANGAPKQPAAPQQIFQQQGLAAGQTWQPLQQLQQQIQQQQQNLNSSNHSSNATSLPPSSRFVTVNPHQRPPQFQQAEEQLKQQQQRQQQQQSSITAESFECGRPFMPCGSAIPAGKTCSQGPGWCQPGYHCGYEVTTAEPSKCLPLPENCGKAGHACCPSNADIPHASLQDKLDRKPFCTDGSYCFFHAPEPGLDNGDVFAGNKGSYACTAVDPSCGAGAGKSCCPFADRIATNPPLNRSGCMSPNMFCNYDMSPAPAVRSELMLASVPGTCELNSADCGQFGKACCVATSSQGTRLTCGVAWNETGPRGYCADPLDSNNSVGPAVQATGMRSFITGGSNNGSSASSNGGSNGGRRSSLRELVCTPCPARTIQVAGNPSKYWPC